MSTAPRTPSPSRLWLYFQETHGMVLTASEESDIRHAANAAAESDICTLETELAATRSERDLAITRVASILRSGAIDKHICGDVRKWVEDWSAELGDAKQEAAHYMSVAQKATDELARLRADNLAAHQMACAAGLERDQLRAEVERLTKQIKDDSRSYGCELRDPNGTIWEQAAKDRARAEKAEDIIRSLCKICATPIGAMKP